MKGTVQMNLQSHTSVPDKLDVPNVNLENSAFTSLFSFKFESQTLSKTIDIYAVSYDSRSKNKCTQMLTIRSCSTKQSTGGSDQKDPAEPKLVLDPMWYAVFCTCRRSGRSCMLMLQLQRQDQEEYIHLVFVLHR